MKYVKLGGNRIDLLSSGAEFFPALLAAIDDAKHEIHLETYIFRNDATGNRVTTALEKAAQRGVSVNVLVDGFGSRDAVTILSRRLEDAGGRLLVYRPAISILSALRRHRLRRLHRKIAVVDARIAFVGGINIIDDDYLLHDGSGTFDFAVRVEGPLLPLIHTTARTLWKRVAWATFKARSRKSASWHADATIKGNIQAVFLVRDNLRNRRSIEQAYLKIIAAAQEEILISSAYFLPGRRFRQALIEAAQRGVKVTLLLQGMTDHQLIRSASQALYGPLLDAGVRIFEYHKAFLHAKVATFDHTTAMVGSSNIDPFSLLLSREANVMVFDRAFTETLHAHLTTAITEDAQEVLLDSWKKQSLQVRLQMWFSYGFVRWAMGLLGINNRDNKG